MTLRFVTRRIHSILDYPVAFSLMALPFVLGIGSTVAAARWLSVGAGVAAMGLTVLTDHETGLLRVIPYTVHVAVDFVVGVVFLAAPTLFGFDGTDALYYWINGGAVVLVVALHRPAAAASG